MPFGLARRFTRPVADCPNLLLPSPLTFSRGRGDIFNGLMRIGSHRLWSRLLPQSLGDRERVDIERLPPDHLIAGLMQLPMMTAAERDGELVADFETQGSGLRKSQVMRIGRLPATDETGL